MRRSNAENVSNFVSVNYRKRLVQVTAVPVNINIVQEEVLIMIGDFNAKIRREKSERHIEILRNTRKICKRKRRDT